MTTTRTRTARKVLGSLGVLGAAAAVAGLGTFGTFTDSTAPLNASVKHRHPVDQPDPGQRHRQPVPHRHRVRPR